MWAPSFFSKLAASRVIENSLRKKSFYVSVEAFLNYEKNNLGRKLQSDELQSTKDARLHVGTALASPWLRNKVRYTDKINYSLQLSTYSMWRHQVLQRTRRLDPWHHGQQWRSGWPCWLQISRYCVPFRLAERTNPSKWKFLEWKKLDRLLIKNIVPES